MRRVAPLAAAALALWKAREERERMQAALREAEEGRARLSRQLRAREAELRRRGEFIENLGRARRAERQFNDELRTQLQRMHEASAPFGSASEGDVSDHVLRAAIGLVEAEKGLLLSRKDEDGDGDLDLVIAHGFDHDPEHSAVVRRFAHEVLARDRIVRVDEPARGDGTPTPADDEIENLVATPVYLLDRFHGVVICANRRGGFADLDDELLLALGDHAGGALQTQRLRNALNDAHRGVLRVLTEALEAYDPMLRRQAVSATMLARALSNRLELEPREQEVIASAASVHDVGHIAIPDRVLQKPGPLSPDERSIMEMHPRAAFAFLREVPALSDVAVAVLHHHERYDGGGYPAGLAGDAIPLPARVLSVVDAYTAMVNDRPFRPRLSREEALAELADEAGGQFDPEIAAVFIDEVSSEDRELDPALAGAVASALDTAAFSSLREQTLAADPLTLLPGHRECRQTVSAALRDGDVTLALVELDELEAINRRDGYAAGDRAIVATARAVERAAQRCGGAAFRDSGRRFGVLVSAIGHDLAAELHTELALGPAVRLSVVASEPHDAAEELFDRARSTLSPPTG